MVAVPTLPSDIGGLLVYFIGLVILWVIISIPVYFAGKAIAGGKASFGSAMWATLGGGLAYWIVFFIISFFLTPVIGESAVAFAILLGVLVWLAVYKGAFKTGWLGAIGIVVLAWIILLILDFILAHTLGVKIPDFFPF